MKAYVKIIEKDVVDLLSVMATKMVPRAHKKGTGQPGFFLSAQNFKKMFSMFIPFIAEVMIIHTY